MNVGLDREKAEKVFRDAMLDDWRPSERWMRWLLDDLAECIINAPDQTLEGRDWIGNPDGTLVYWQAEADAARAKIARVKQLCTELDTPGTSFDPTKRLRAILDASPHEDLDWLLSQENGGDK